jgi:hypothetical protein
MASMLSGKLVQRTVTTQNLAPATGTPTTGSTLTTRAAGYNTMAVQTVGTYTGALSLQTSIDGINWVTVGGTPFRNMNTGTTLVAITSALQSTFQVDITGFNYVRISALAAVTGSVAVSAYLSEGNAMVALSQGLPAGAAALGSVTTTGTTTNTPLVPTNYALNSAATTNATSVKATAGNLLSLTMVNFSASAKFVKLYAKATAPTVGTDIPVDVIEIAANSSKQMTFGQGLPFLLGIALAITGAQPDADATAVAAGDVKVHMGYI